MGRWGIVHCEQRGIWDWATKDRVVLEIQIAAAISKKTEDYRILFSVEQAAQSNASQPDSSSRCENQ